MSTKLGSAVRLYSLIVPLLIGGTLLVVGLVGYRKETRLDNEGVTVQGDVRGRSQSRSTRRGTKYQLKIAYRPQGQDQTFEDTFAVSNDVFTEADRTGKAPVTYLPSEPRTARARRSSMHWFFLGFGVVATLAGLANFALRRRSAAAPDPPADATHADAASPTRMP